MSFPEFWQKNTLFGKANYGMYHYSLKVIDERKMSEIRSLNLCHKKSTLVDIYRQSLLNVFPPPYCFTVATQLPYIYGLTLSTQEWTNRLAGVL